MDIVSRLKSFINYKNLQVTQFADNCKIPRPTLSQLLNGRNKKVSDEFISKIHEAYPELSVLWLMFGEGDMLYSANIETSEPQTGRFIDFSAHQPTDTEDRMPRLDFGETISGSGSDKFQATKSVEEVIPTANTGVLNSIPTKDSSGNTASQTFTVSNDSKKQIVNIIVYYNDNSFESFVPGRKE